MESQLESLGKQIKEDDQDFLDMMAIKQRVSAMTLWCAAVRKKTDEHVVLYERLLADISTFMTVTSQLRVYLDEATVKLDKLEPIHNDADIIRAQLKETQVNLRLILISARKRLSSFTEIIITSLSFKFIARY